MECIKVQHRPFQCLLPVNAGEVKTEDLLEMPHILAKQSCSEQAHINHKEDEKTPTTEVEISDAEDQGIDEECTGKAE